MLFVVRQLKLERATTACMNRASNCRKYTKSRFVYRLQMPHGEKSLLKQKKSIFQEKNVHTVSCPNFRVYILEIRGLRYIMVDAMWPLFWYRHSRHGTSVGGGEREALHVPPLLQKEPTAPFKKRRRRRRVEKRRRMEEEEKSHKGGGGGVTK